MPLPFVAMLHPGHFNTMDYQAARDYVELSGSAEMGALRAAYQEKLILQGVPQGEAIARAAGVQGAIVLMYEQFMVLGIRPPTDQRHNQIAWEMVAKHSRYHIGAKVGQAARDRSRDRTAHNIGRPQPRFTPAADADQVSKMVDQHMRTRRS